MQHPQNPQHANPHAQQQQQPQTTPSLITPDEASDRQLLDLLQMMDTFSPVVPLVLPLIQAHSPPRSRMR